MILKKLRNLCALGLAGAMFCGTMFSVTAISPRDLFDADYYAEQYPDVVAAVGDDEAALYNHYVKHGMKEGRSLSPVFDVKSYRERYSDLEAAFGDDWSAYMNHMVEHGLCEDRYTVDKNVHSLTAEQALTIYAAKINARIEKEGVEAVLGDFDTEAYKAANPDVVAAFGNDTERLIEHYLEHGIKEGRTSTTDKAKDPVEAIKSNPNVITSVTDFSPEAIVEKAEEVKQSSSSSSSDSSSAHSCIYSRVSGTCETGILMRCSCGDEFTYMGRAEIGCKWSEDKRGLGDDAATCTKPGIQYYYCEYCYDIDEDSIEEIMAWHDLLLDLVITNRLEVGICVNCAGQFTREQLENEKLGQ